MVGINVFGCNILGTTKYPMFPRLIPRVYHPCGKEQSFADHFAGPPVQIPAFEPTESILRSKALGRITPPHPVCADSL